jgi:hypothetical protein
MAQNLNSKHIERPPKKHPGIHAKTKQSFNPGSSQYIKRRVGQGK